MDFLQSAWNGHLQGQKNVKGKENAKKEEKLQTLTLILLQIQNTCEKREKQEPLKPTRRPR